MDVYFHIQIEVGTEFNQGVKQKTIITIDDVQNETTYEVEINNITYSFTSDADATEDEITAGLTAAINNNANGWVPVTATDNVDGTIDLDSDYEGNAFVAIAITSSLLSISEDTPNSGDQQSVIQEVVDFSEDEQTISTDVFISRYFTAVNEVNDIESISITHSIATPPVSAPPGGGDWSSASTIVIDTTELAVFDTLRVSVEII